MQPVLLTRFKGFLIRIVHNGAENFAYEWTIDEIKNGRRIRHRDPTSTHTRSGSLRWAMRVIENELLPQPSRSP